MSSPSPPGTPLTSDGESEPKNCYDEREARFRTAFFPQLRMLPVATSSPHPFAASSKATRDPPLYEKKLQVPPGTPPELLTKSPPATTREYQRQRSSLLVLASPSLDESVQKLWDTAISSAIDSAKAKIDLSGNNLTYIPPSIIDLENLVVLPQVTRCVQDIASVPPRSFKRSATAPAIFTPARGSRPFLPTSTTSALKLKAATKQKFDENHSRSEIELYLMRNAIRVLPRELFGLDCLVVLSLRQNKLTSLPPSIHHLTRLRELNIASNRLAYLPAEILKLRLTSLQLHPNPFISPPSNHSDTRGTPILGSLTRESTMPTLSEIMLRYLLAPATLKGGCPTRLEASVSCSLDSLSLPSHIQCIVRASTEHGIASEQGTDAEKDVTANICPNPEHGRSGFPWGKGISDHVFYTPVETRMEWVSVVAGVQVAESLQALVPVLWRGCNKGCLAFLEDEEDLMEDYTMSVFTAGTGEEGEPFEFSDEE